MNRTDLIRHLEAHDLPEGWSETTVGQVAEDISYGFTAKASSSETGPRYLRITDLQNGTVDWGSVPSCRIPKEKIKKYVLRQGDIVFARTGATTGKSFLVRSCPEAVFASYLIRVRPSTGILPEFLAFFFQTSSYWNQISENIAGSAQPNCNATKLAALDVPIPPLDEQRRIVAKLEVLLGKLGACQKRLAKIPAILKRFRRSVLADACSGHLTADWRETQNHSQSVSRLLESLRVRRKQVWQSNKRDEPKRSYNEAVRFDPNDLPVIPNTWEWTSADAVCSQITDGEHIQPRYHSQGRPMLTAKHVRDGYVTFDNPGYIKETDFRKCLKRCAPANGDILIVSVGATTGRSAIVEDCPPFAIVRSVLLLKPLVDSLYLLRWIQSPRAFTWMTQASGASAQPHLYIKDTKRMPVPIAPLAEQQEIIRRVDALFKSADQIEARYKKVLAHIHKLTQSILAKAFRGELVPTETELVQRGGRKCESPADPLAQSVRPN